MSGYQVVFIFLCGIFVPVIGPVWVIGTGWHNLFESENKETHGFGFFFLILGVILLGLQIWLGVYYYNNGHLPE